MIRGGSGSYRLRMNQSEIEAEIHTLRDGGLLMQASICSLNTYVCVFFLFCSFPHNNPIYHTQIYSIPWFVNILHYYFNLN